MKKPNVVRKIAGWVAAVLVVVLVATSITAFTLLRRPLPAQGGEVELQGLTGPVEVLRDERGVPHLYADTAHDLFYAQGYVHAQDRFFEMDYRRHLTAGRLAELVGDSPAAISADQVIRTMGWRQVAEEEWPGLSQETREYFQAYADGVNAYISKRSPSQLALEYTVLGLQVQVEHIAPWEPVDSLAWLKAMAWDLLSNFDDELARAAIYGELEPVYGAEAAMTMVEEVFPAYQVERNLPIITTPELLEGHEEFLAGQPATNAAADSAGEAAGADSVDPGDVVSALDLAGTDVWGVVQAAFDAVPNSLGEGDGIGSNSWVIAGEYTESGMPLLANDPHLAISAPGIWYQMGLHCTTVTPECPFEVTGFTFSGLPAVVIGRNADLAWGFTNLAPDVADLFLERIYPDGTYEYDGERLPLIERAEIIKVNGGEDREITVRSTPHGPIISDALLSVHAATSTPVEGNPGAAQYGVALAWTALTPGSTGDALVAISTAKDAADIARAGALFEVPSQNIVFATTTGDIGYQAPGTVPVRNKVPGALVPADGRWPRPGWDSRYDWQGTIPANEMPAELNPEEGFIVTANQPVLAPGDTPFLSLDHDYGYRSQAIRDRITTQIEQGRKFTVEDMNSIHLDDSNPFAEMLMPYLLEIKVEDPFVTEAIELFDDWDQRADVDSAATAYFFAVWTNLLRLTFWDQVPEGQRPGGGSQWLEAVRGLLEDETNTWWDDRATLNVVETRDEVLITALVQAREQLTVLLGKDPKAWTWGQLHKAAPTHDVLGGEGIPGIVRGIVNLKPIGVAGGSSIVNANGWDAASWDRDTSYPRFGVTAVPSMRMVVDMVDIDVATWVSLTGNSGHPMSKNYDDQFGAWAEGTTFPWPMSKDAVTDAAIATQWLLPPGGK